MDKIFFEIGGVVRALIYFYQNKGTFLRIDYRRGVGLSSTTAIRVHDFLYEHGLIEIHPEPHALLFHLTEKGKKIAQLLEITLDIFEEKIDPIKIENAIIMLQRLLDEKKQEKK